VLDDVAADRLNSHIQVLGIGRNPDAGGGYFQVRCSMLICHGVCLPTDSSSAREVRDSSSRVARVRESATALRGRPRAVRHYLDFPSPLKAYLPRRKAPAARGVRGLPGRAQPPLPDLLALGASGE
jgi:hypothetical protein